MKRFSLLIIIFLFASSAPINALATVDAAAEEQLEADLAAVEAEIADFEKELATATGEKKTLTNKIQQLKKEQSSLRLKIKATTVRLDDLETKLSAAERAIEMTAAKIADVKAELASTLQLMHWEGGRPLLFYLLKDGGLGAALQERTNYERLSNQLKLLSEKAALLREEIETKKRAYEIEALEVGHLLALSQAEQSALFGKLKEHNDLLDATKGRESSYQKMIESNKKRAAEIKSRLYELLGVSTDITFGEAVSIAQWVEKQTGVSAAFLLAILSQESNLGKNVGTCNRLGDPPEKSWQAVMKPNRDREPFLAITKELGRDPDTTPVSCPMKDKKGRQIGYGGAMGPAQFIPSTWVGYKERVSALTGKVPADPWDIRDSFVAAALLLKNNGADNTRDGQWKAAMRYFSGGTNKRYRFYGDSVLELKEKYEIDMMDLSS